MGAFDFKRRRRRVFTGFFPATPGSLGGSRLEDRALTVPVFVRPAGMAFGRYNAFSRSDVPNVVGDPYWSSIESVPGVSATTYLFTNFQGVDAHASGFTWTTGLVPVDDVTHPPAFQIDVLHSHHVDGVSFGQMAGPIAQTTASTGIDEFQMADSSGTGPLTGVLDIAFSISVTTPGPGTGQLFNLQFQSNVLNVVATDGNLVIENVRTGAVSEYPGFGITGPHAVTVAFTIPVVSEIGFQYTSWYYTDANGVRGQTSVYDGVFMWSVAVSANPL